WTRSEPVCLHLPITLFLHHDTGPSPGHRAPTPSVGRPPPRLTAVSQHLGHNVTEAGEGVGFLQTGESSEWRCDTAEALARRRCDKDNQFNPDTKPQELMNKELSNSPGNEVQLKPQNIRIPLRLGYPIDLYYLMDLSFSMADDLDTIKKLSQDIIETLRGFTKNIRIEKKKSEPVSPAEPSRCQPAVSYQNILSLTPNTDDFKREDAIGWKNVTKILVYTSDDTFHIAGDGRLAGIYSLTMDKCHLNQSGFYDGTKFELRKMIPQSVVGVLESDSSNVVQLITNAYNVDFTVRLNISECLKEKLEFHLSVQGISDKLKVTVEMQCNCDPGFRGQRCCEQSKDVDSLETKCRQGNSSQLCNGHGSCECGECLCHRNFKGRHCERLN
ncbi:hypothetical protein CRUP_022635, partial [Coryphaenoides rupestris]